MPMVVGEVCLLTLSLALFLTHLSFQVCAFLPSRDQDAVGLPFVREDAQLETFCFKKRCLYTLRKP